MTTVVQRQRCVPSTWGCYYPSEDFGYLDSWVSSDLTFKLGANSHNYAKTSKKEKKRKEKKTSLLKYKCLHQSGFRWNPVNSHTMFTLYTLREAVVGLISRPQEVCLLTPVKSVLVIHNVYLITVITNDDMHSLQS